LGFFWVDRVAGHCYILSTQKQNLHPTIDKILKKFPNKIQDFKNLIFYGPSGVGKYSLVLKSIKKYSPTELKYEKKISVTYNKEQYYFKISDVHYEVDLSMLGCNSKLLWHEIYMQIVDIISAKTNKIGIIVCKYFQEIHSELLENFYSYMQQNNSLSIDLKFVLITEHLSFIPDNIINCCEVIQVPRPSKINYNKCLKNKLPASFKLEEISNIKNVNSMTNQYLMQPYKIICNKIIDVIINTENYQLLKMRDMLYDIFIYNLNIDECIWYIIFTLVNNGAILQENMSKIMIKTYTFFQYYNNNYRPIYHLENYILFLSSIVNINT
jgi:hypothetical protein